MRIWQQTEATTLYTGGFSFDSTQSAQAAQTGGANLLDLDILNTSSLNFARPASPRQSHTASTTADRRIQRDREPPRLRINTKVIHGTNNHHTSTNGNNSKSSQNSWWPQQHSDHLAQVYDTLIASKAPKHYQDRMVPGLRAVETTNSKHKKPKVEEHPAESGKDEDVTGPKNISSQATVEVPQRQETRMGQGEQPTVTLPISTEYSETQETLAKPVISVSVDHMCGCPENDIFDDKKKSDVDNSALPLSTTTMITLTQSFASSTNSMSPSRPPSLSPCSSTSSLSSSVDVLTPALTNMSQSSNNDPLIARAQNRQYLDHPNQYPHQQRSMSLTAASPLGHVKFVMPDARPRNQAYDSQFRANFVPNSPDFPATPYGRPKSKSISTETPFSQKAQISSESYSSVPWSPAVSFLATLANSTLRSPMPDDEGEQIGEYVLGKVIGRGGFSTVREAYMIGPGSEKVAVKIVKNNPEHEDNNLSQALLRREVAVWRMLEHPNLVKMISVEEKDYATFIFCEYCPNGTLLQYVKKNGIEGKLGLAEDEAREIFLQIAEAVRYLHHEMGLVHKDIKLDNIILDSEATWKLCDFGLTDFQNSTENGFANGDCRCDEAAGGSLAYCPPEQLRSKVPIKDPSVDIWSLGAVLFALVTGRLPFNDDYAPRLQFKILNGRFDESALNTSEASDDLRSLLKGMFKTKPDQRLTITQVLEHRWCER